MIRKAKKLIIYIILLSMVLIPKDRVSAESESYTYTYEYFDFQLESPDAYTPQALLLGTDLGIGDFNNPKSLFVRDEYLYIVDSGNNRIVVVDRYFELIRVIDKVIMDGEEVTFLNPSDVYVTATGICIYVTPI